MRKLKHNFAVNQVWISKEYPEKSFYIYQLFHREYDDAVLENEESFYLAVLINEKLFNRKVEEYQETHNVKDRTSTYPFCIYKEGHINSLKRYVSKYNCELVCVEDFKTETYEGGELVAVEDENSAISKIWEKYSK